MFESIKSFFSSFSTKLHNAQNDLEQKIQSAEADAAKIKAAPVAQPAPPVETVPAPVPVVAPVATPKAMPTIDVGTLPPEAAKTHVARVQRKKTSKPKTEVVAAKTPAKTPAAKTAKPKTPVKTPAAKAPAKKAPAKSVKK